MKEWLNKFFAGDTGKPSRTGVGGIFLLLVYAVCICYSVATGNTTVLEKLSTGITSLIVMLLLGAKAADAYTAGKKIGAGSSTVPTVPTVAQKADPPPPKDTAEK